MKNWDFMGELNNLKRITMVPEYSAICGITEQELHEQWGDAVTEIHFIPYLLQLYVGYFQCFTGKWD